VSKSHHRATFSTSGSSYLNVTLTTMHHLYIVAWPTTSYFALVWHFQPRFIIFECHTVHCLCTVAPCCRRVCMCRSSDAAESRSVWIQWPMWLLTEAGVHATSWSSVWSVRWVDSRRRCRRHRPSQSNSISAVVGFCLCANKVKSTQRCCRGHHLRG